jgi:hypothetical protein
MWYPEQRNMIPYKLRDWIDQDKLCWIYLCRNPNAGQLLEQNIDQIDWENLSSNSSPRAIRILEQHILHPLHSLHSDKINWSYLSSNPGAVDLLKKHQANVHWRELAGNPCPRAIHLLEHYVTYRPKETYKPEYSREVWDILSENPSAIHILEANPDKIDWYGLSENPRAIHLLEKNLDKIDWFGLSTNPAALPILEKNLDKINWAGLHWNKHPKAMELLEKNALHTGKIDWSDISFHPHAIPLLENPLHSDKIDWDGLSENPNALHLLEKNQEKIYWKNFSMNPNIFVYDYDKMKEDKSELHEELLAMMLHPDNVSYFEGWGLTVV